MEEICHFFHGVVVGGGERVPNSLEEWCSGDPAWAFEKESKREKADRQEQGVLKINYVQLELTCTVVFEEKILVVDITVAENKFLFQIKARWWRSRHSKSVTACLLDIRSETDRKGRAQQGGLTRVICPSNSPMLRYTIEASWSLKIGCRMSRSLWLCSYGPGVASLGTGIRRSS